MMKAGKMRLTITIEQKGSAGLLGQTVWETFVTKRAELESVTGRELAAPLTGAEVSHIFTLRYVAGVKAHMRVNVAGRTFNIKYILTGNEGNARLLRMYCQEVSTESKVTTLDYDLGLAGEGETLEDDHDLEEELGR